MDVIADSADPLLFATWDGLFRWNGKRWQVLDQHNGLPCGGLVSLIKDRNDSLWIQGPCGLLKVEASELDKWRRDEARSVAVTNFDVSDGVKAWRAFSIQPVMSLAPDGRLWFANGNTIESIDTEHIYKNNFPPPVHVEQLVADGTSYPSDRKVRIPPNPHNLEIDYTGLSFSFPRKVQFRYFLEGYDRDWQGPVTRRQAFYTDLAPNPVDATYGVDVARDIAGILPADVTNNAAGFPSGPSGPAKAITTKRQAKFEIAQTVTVEAWVDVTKSSTGTIDLVSYGPEELGQPYTLQLLPTGTICFFTTTTSGYGLVTGGTALTLNAPHLLDATYDGATMQVYVDGRLDGSAAAAGALNYAAEKPQWGLSIGTAYDTYRQAFSGVLSDVAVYGSALTPERIAAHWSAGSGNPSGP